MNLAIFMVEVEQALICNFAVKHLLSVQIDKSAVRAEVYDICSATVVDNFIARQHCSLEYIQFAFIHLFGVMYVFLEISESFENVYQIVS